MIVPPSEFTTRSLRLRPPVMADAGGIFEEYASDPAVTRYLIWAPHESEDTVARFLREMLARREAGAEFSWILARPDRDRPIGMIGAHMHGHMAEIGYVLGRAYWQRGYMTEAITVVSEWLLDQAEIFRVWAVCDTENTGSARALEKAGFEREALLRRWIMHPNRSPAPRDCYSYARVR